MILLVDDDDDILESVREVLEHYGFAVVTASSAADARKVLAYCAVDTIIADLDLGAGESGDELLQYAARRFPSANRLIYSATAMAGVQSDCVITVEKPNIDQLVHALQELHAARRGRGRAASSPPHSFEATTVAQLREEMTLIAHDLNSPLAVIAANLGHVAAHLDGDASAAAALDDIRSALAQATRLVATILELARLESPMDGRRRTTCAIAQLIRTAVEPRARIAQRRGIEVCLGPLCDRQIELDADLMMRVLENIVDNALRYTPAGGRIEVAAFESAERVVMTIGNSGPEIPAAERERIFTKHARWGAATTSMNLGLGLYFCRRAVEAHDGTIRVESTVELPTLFVIELPGG